MAVASTGVIGVPLPIELGDRRDRAGDGARSRPDGDGDFAHAIRTTDAFAKRACLDVDCSAGHGHA